MNDCSIIRLRPNLSTIGQQKPDAAQLPHRLFKLFASMSACLFHQTLRFLRWGESYFASSRQILFVAYNLRCTEVGGAFFRINTDPVGTCLWRYAINAKGLLLLCNILWFKVDFALILMVYIFNKTNGFEITRPDQGIWSFFFSQHYLHVDNGENCTPLSLHSRTMRAFTFRQMSNTLRRVNNEKLTTESKNTHWTVTWITAFSSKVKVLHWEKELSAEEVIMSV